MSLLQIILVKHPREIFISLFQVPEQGIRFKQLAAGIRIL
jgi:hypothetical protein